MFVFFLRRSTIKGDEDETRGRKKKKKKKKQKMMKQKKKKMKKKKKREDDAKKKRRDRLAEAIAKKLRHPTPNWRRWPIIKLDHIR